MLDLVFQVAGLCLLIGGLWWGYQRWIVPHRQTLTPAAQGLLFLLVLTCMGGLIGSPFWWLDDPRAFSWDLPPLAGRMLGAAGWTFAIATALVLSRPTARRVQLLLLLLAIYLVPLVAVILLFHLDRFDPDAPVTYAFFLIAGGMSLATLWYLFHRPPLPPETPAESQPPPPQTQRWLMLVATLTALWGAALFATDSGPAALIWVWPGDLLTSRLIAVMLLAVAGGATFSLSQQATAHIMLVVTAAYGLGIALASLWNSIAGLPIKFSYLLVFGLLALISTLLLQHQRRPLPQPAHRGEGG